MVYRAEPDLPAESFTVTVNRRSCVSDNVPVTVQVSGSRRKPLGSAPAVTEHVKGGNPPV